MERIRSAWIPHAAGDAAMEVQQGSTVASKCITIPAVSHDKRG
jgi:hypothetical protein